MAQSYSLKSSRASATPPALEPRRVLVTGAAGRIGSCFARFGAHKYNLRLMVQEGDNKAGELHAYGEVVTGELGDLPRLQSLCEGMDTVIHLAADPRPSASWESLLPNNIIGTYNLFLAANQAKCRRVVFASSIHTVSGYPLEVQVKTSDPVNPADLYGVTKCFGEALGRYMAEQAGLSVIALRIGSFSSLEKACGVSGLKILDSFVSDRDLMQLIERSIEVEELQFAILNGLSNNLFKRLDVSDARELVGYAPEDDLTEEQIQLKDLHLRNTLVAYNSSDKPPDGLKVAVSTE
jgi:hypothetical protein